MSRPTIRKSAKPFASRESMTANVLKTARCKVILANATPVRTWSTARIARAIGNYPEYVERIKAGEQSLQVSDLEALAAACGKQSYELIFESIDSKRLTSQVYTNWRLSKSNCVANFRK